MLQNQECFKHIVAFLHRLHILAVVFSLTGAVLISDPAQAISSMGCLDFCSEMVEIDIILEENTVW